MFTADGLSTTSFSAHLIIFGGLLAALSSADSSRVSFMDRSDWRDWPLNLFHVSMLRATK